jgi:hypothetical protein
MKQKTFKATFSLILIAGLFIGMVKGKEVRQKWVAKMKNRKEEKQVEQAAPVLLDEFEITAYHS